jgi:hypothetical protein
MPNEGKRFENLLHCSVCFAMEGCQPYDRPERIELGQGWLKALRSVKAASKSLKPELFWLGAWLSLAPMLLVFLNVAFLFPDSCFGLWCRKRERAERREQLKREGKLLTGKAKEDAERRARAAQQFLKQAGLDPDAERE